LNISGELGVQSGSIGDAECFVEVRKVLLFRKADCDFRICGVLVISVGLEFSEGCVDGESRRGLFQETGSFNVEFFSSCVIVTFVNVSWVGEVLLIVETVVEFLHNLEVGESEI
jgi:hypothetical protein